VSDQDNQKVISKLDASNMLGLISRLPEQCREAHDIGEKAGISKPKSEINSIVFAGLGGSAIGADIIRVYLRNEIKVPIVVSRNYSLPGFVGKDTLLFCASYSGNTEETLSSFEDGLKKEANVITIGSGGRLKELSLKHGFSHIDIPTGYPPRTAVGYMSLSVLAVLSNLGFIGGKGEEVKALCRELTAIRDKELGIGVPKDKNIAKQIASGLLGKHCVVYGTTDTTEAAAIRWRGQLAENAKSLASSHVFPEMNHNEIVGWDFPKEVLRETKVIMLRDSNDHPRTQKRIEISKAIIKRSGAGIFEIERKGPSLLARLFSIIYIGDFVSFYLAILNNVDPTPVKQIDYLKNELAKK